MIANILQIVFAPNKYTIIGFVLLFLGILLLPILIGIFLISAASIFLVIGFHYSIIKLIPGHEKFIDNIKNLYKPYIKLWKKQ
jgi:hypothetical protein